MKKQREKVKERTDKALIKLLKTKADSEDEAVEEYMKDIDLENFSRTLAQMQSQLTYLEEQIHDVKIEESKENKGCCCCGGCCK